MTSAARPGGLIPEHLWLADDEDKLVVSVLAPEVAGDARHDTAGPVTVVSPYPVTRPGGMYATRPAEVGLWTPRSGGARIGWAGAVGSTAVAAAGVWAAGPWVGVAVAAVGLGITVWQALRRYTRVARLWAEGCQVLTDYDDRAVVQAAAKNVRYIATAWTRLRAHVDLDDPTQVLVGQLWDLTLLVGERAEVRELRKELQMAGHGVPEGTSTAADLAEWIRGTDGDVARLTENIEQRRTDLSRLADEVARFLTEQQALARARATICEVDQRRRQPAPPVGAAEELVDHAAAVLAAYRELT
jgi:hypothetical protein